MVPQMSDMAQMAKICRQNTKDVIEIFRRKRKAKNTKPGYGEEDEDPINQSMYGRFEEKDIAEKIHEDDREIDRLLWFSGLTPRDYLNSFPKQETENND